MVHDVRRLGDLLTPGEVVTILRTHRKTIDQWPRDRLDVPQHITIAPGSTRYFRYEIDRWLLGLAAARPRSGAFEDDDAA